MKDSRDNARFSGYPSPLFRHHHLCFAGGKGVNDMISQWREERVIKNEFQKNEHAEKGEWKEEGGERGEENHFIPFLLHALYWKQ